MFSVNRFLFSNQKFSSSINTPTYDCDFTTMSTLSDLTDKGWTFNRTGLGTYIDSSGTLKYNRHNLCLRSQDFANWTAAGTTVTSDITTDPFGGSTADRLNEDSSLGQGHGRTSANVGVVNLKDYVCTFSVYLKEDTSSSPARPTAIINFVAGSSGAISMAFDLRNGVTLGTPSTRAGTEYTDYGISSEGNNWYRCWVTMRVPWAAGNSTAVGGVYMSNTAVGVAPTLLANGGAIQYNGAGTGARIFAWGAQVEVAPSPQSYIPTTNAAIYWPRLNSTYGLLISQSSTNQLNWSETFAASGGANNNWTLFNLTATTGSVSPNGLTTAVRFTHNGLNPGAGSVSSTTAIGTTSLRSFSVWVRRVTGTGNVWYSYNNGTTTTNFVGLTTSWQRYEFSSTSNNHQIALGIDTVGDEVEFWGVQLESTGYPSEYIHTANSQVSRTSDFCEIRAAQATFLSASEGTLISESAWLFALSGGSTAATLVRLGQGGAPSWYGVGNFTYTGLYTNEGYRFLWNYNPTQTSDTTSIAPVSMAFRKFGFKYVLGTSMRGWLNGSAGSALTPSSSMTVLDKVDIVCSRLSVATSVLQTGTSRVGGAWTKRIRYWNTALSDADMVTLTT